MKLYCVSSIIRKQLYLSGKDIQPTLLRITELSKSTPMNLLFTMDEGCYNLRFHSVHYMVNGKYYNIRGLDFEHIPTMQRSTLHYRRYKSKLKLDEIMFSGIGPDLKYNSLNQALEYIKLNLIVNALI